MTLLRIWLVHSTALKVSPKTERTLNREKGNLQTYKKLHFRYLFVNLFHELDYEVHQFMLQHLLSVSIGDQERYVITLLMLMSTAMHTRRKTLGADFNRFPS